MKTHICNSKARRGYADIGHLVLDVYTFPHLLLQNVLIKTIDVDLYPQGKKEKKYYASLYSF